MGTETIRTCDVYGRRKDVKRYAIGVIEVVDGKMSDKHAFYYEADLSPKALERAGRLALKATSSPKRKAKAAS